MKWTEVPSSEIHKPGTVLWASFYLGEAASVLEARVTNLTRMLKTTRTRLTEAKKRLRIARKLPEGRVEMVSRLNRDEP